MSQADLKRRVEAAAAAALARQKFVTPIDVCVGLGWLHTSNVEDWRRGRVDDLEYFLPVHDDRLTDLILYVHQWAQAHGLTRTDTDYVSATRDRRPLRFLTNGDPLEEAAWRSQWISADVPAAQRERIAKRQATAPDLVVVQPVKDWTCAECGGTGSLLIMDDKGPLCLTCADMDHLVFLPSGDAALTRRAKKASTLSAVVVRWSRARKRYERQGLLVEEPALEQAEQQCLADEDARMRRRERDAERRADEDLELLARFVMEIARLFPGCPAGRAEAIARHTSLRGSGRVGRSAAGRSVDEKAVTLAVVASVRHEDTDYDSLLMSGVPRETARDRVRPDIDRVLHGWALPAPGRRRSRRGADVEHPARRRLLPRRQVHDAVGDLGMHAAEPAGVVRGGALVECPHIAFVRHTASLPPGPGRGDRNMPDNGLVARRTTIRTAAAAGVVGPVVFTGAWLVSSLRQTGHGAAEVQISGLAAPDARDPWIMITGFLVLGGCAVAFGEALHEAIGGPAPRLIQGTGVLTVAAGLLRRDHMLLQPGPVSWHNHAHDAVSAVIYVDLVVAQALLARGLARDAAWKPWPRWLAAGAAATTAALVAYGANTAEPAAGALQRVAVTLPLAAIAALAARLAILRQPAVPGDVRQ